MNFLIYLGIFPHLFEQLFLLLRVLHAGPVFELSDASDVDVSSSDVAVVPRIRQLMHIHYSCDPHSVSWNALGYVVSVCDH